MSLPPRVEGESLPHLEGKHIEEWCVWRKERGPREIRGKVQGTEAKRKYSGGKCNASVFLNKMGRRAQSHTTVRVYARGAENSDCALVLLAASVHGPQFGDSQQASASQGTHTGKDVGSSQESCKHDHRMECFNILECAWFWIELFPPFSPPLQACSAGALLNQVESESVPKWRGSPKTFLWEVMISYRVQGKKGNGSSGNNTRT